MWEIYAYQNSDSLFGIFNAITAMMGAENYTASLVTVVLCGFIAALLAYAFAPEKLQGWKWLASITLVFTLLIVPRVTVGIVDKTGSAPVKIVDNVPLGIAFFGGITNAVGSTLTLLFETAFQLIPGPGALPSELTYQKNGLMFGNRLIRETSNVIFQDPNFRTDLINFIHNCTMYDLMDGTINPSLFAQSSDVWNLMATPNPARFSTSTASNSTISIDTCPNVYRNLDGRIPAQLIKIQDRMAFRLNPTLPASLATSVIATQIQQAYIKNNLANASATAADLIRQNAMLNAINDTSKLVGQKINDPASMVLAVGRAQAVAQQNASWLNYGKIAEQSLPVFRNVIEAITYALFPLVMLLLMMTSGRETMLAIKSYVSILIWIQLWPPLYAILNYMASIYAAYDLASAADIGGGSKALALQTASSIYSNAISGEAIVGSLVISIPFIAWAALKRMESFGTALVGGLSSLQATVSSTTGSSSSGNMNMGNVAMDQMQLSPNRSSAFMSSQQNDMTGDTLASNALNGRSAVSLLRNQGFASRIVSMKVSEQDVADSSRQVSSAWNEAVSAKNEHSAALTEAFTKGLSKYRSTQSNKGTSNSRFEQMGESLNKLDQISKGIAERTGLTQTQVAQIAFGASGYLGLKTEIAGIQANAQAGQNYQSGLTADQQKVLNSLSNEQIDVFKQFGDRVSRDASILNSFSSDARDSNEMSARMNTTTARTQRADAALSDRIAYQERVSSAHEKGETISIDLAQDPHNQEMFMRYVQQYGGSSASAMTMFDSELARQGLKANQTFSDGSAMPASFNAVKTDHENHSHDPALNPDIKQTYRAHQSQLSPKGKFSFNKLPEPSPDVRQEVHSESDRLHEQTQQKEMDFDENTAITKTEDGLPLTRKSLLGDAAKQAGADSADALKNIKDATRNILK